MFVLTLWLLLQLISIKFLNVNMPLLMVLPIIVVPVLSIPLVLLTVQEKVPLWSVSSELLIVRMLR